MTTGLSTSRHHHDVHDAHEAREGTAQMNLRVRRGLRGHRE
jgi:hypothetical protein